MPNNLLVVTSRYPHKSDDISNVFVYNYIEYLKDFFDKVYILSATPYTPTFLTRLLKPLRELDSLAEDYSYDNVIVHFLKGYYFPFRLGYSSRGRQCLRLAEKYISENKLSFNLVHAHFSWPSGYVAAGLKTNFKVPVFLTLHENRDWLLSQHKYEYVREVWRQMDGIIRVNKIDLKLIEKYNENVLCIPCGFDHKLYENISQDRARTSLGLDNDEKIFFSLGHLIERKGFLDLLEAAKILRDKGKDFKLYIGGDGPMKKKLQKAIVDYGLKNVELLGFLRTKDIPLWMNAADVFVLTSYSEGNPAVIFEALGCGKPVISTKVGGVPEVLVNADIGLLVENNPSDIANKLDLAMEKDWDERSIKKYGLSFTIETLASKTVQFYESVLKDYNYV